MHILHAYSQARSMLVLYPDPLPTLQESGYETRSMYDTVMSGNKGSITKILSNVEHMNAYWFC